ncbi:MAG: FAD-binding oxidoreductase [Candidatus Lindowbacteria bacterium]|nr:FAD-binding oxidoreductase [Candidatus Lindowbacteria bacterium]
MCNETFAAKISVDYRRWRCDSRLARRPLEAPPIRPAPRLEGEKKVNLAIIGSGYTGLSCAYYAKKSRPEWSVAVLESHRLGSGASSRNSGAVSPRYRGLGGNEMTHRGFGRLMRFINAEEIQCDFKHGPVIELCASKGSAEKTRATLAPGSKWIAPEELKESMRTSFYWGAVESGEYSTLHPGKLVAGHVEACSRLGVELYQNSPVLGVRRGKPAELITPAAKVRADHVFVATNAYTPRLGFLRYVMMPVHQYTFATRRLTEKEITDFGLTRWAMRFERSVLPVTTHITPTGHFFIRIVLGYACFNSCKWRDIEGARKLAKEMFERRYPWMADVGLEHGWHGVTGHTLKGREIACPVMGENIHVSAAYNGLGVMPGHNNGYLTACRITGHDDGDVRLLQGPAGHYPLPGEFYRSIMFKPFMRLAMPK